MLGRATEEPQTVNRKVLLRKVAIGEVSALRHVFFDFGKATLQEASFEELNMMVTMMKQTNLCKWRSVAIPMMWVAIPSTKTFATTSRCRTGLPDEQWSYRT